MKKDSFYVKIQPILIPPRKRLRLRETPYPAISYILRLKHLTVIVYGMDYWGL